MKTLRLAKVDGEIPEVAGRRRSMQNELSGYLGALIVVSLVLLAFCAYALGRIVTALWKFHTGYRKVHGLDE